MLPITAEELTFSIAPTAAPKPCSACTRGLVPFVAFAVKYAIVAANCDTRACAALNSCCAMLTEGAEEGCGGGVTTTSIVTATLPEEKARARSARTETSGAAWYSVRR